MLNEKEEKVLQLVRMRGPILPIDIAKAVGLETFLASAILSTLINKGHVKISHRKVGSSPLYYVDGQEQKLRNRLYSELNDLEKKALERLKQLRVAFKEDLYPQERVLLSELRDFVSYLQIKKDEKELFCWRHYSVTDDEFNEILQKKFEPQKEEVEQVVEKPEVQKRLEIKKEKVKQPIKKIKLRKEAKNDFDKRVIEFFKKNNVEVLERKVSRNESDYLISIQTPLGGQKYFVKVKNKKSISESDISKLYVEISSKKYPAILIIPKQLSKKVRAYVDKNFGNLIRIIVLQ